MVTASSSANNSAAYLNIKVNYEKLLNKKPVKHITSYL